MGTDTTRLARNSSPLCRRADAEIAETSGSAVVTDSGRQSVPALFPLGYMRMTLEAQVRPAPKATRST